MIGSRQQTDRNCVPKQVSANQLGNRSSVGVRLIEHGHLKFGDASITLERIPSNIEAGTECTAFC